MKRTWSSIELKAIQEARLSYNALMRLPDLIGLHIKEKHAKCHQVNCTIFHDVMGTAGATGLIAEHLEQYPILINQLLTDYDEVSPDIRKRFKEWKRDTPLSRLAEVQRLTEALVKFDVTEKHRLAKE